MLKDRLKSLRAEKELSQRDLASLLELSPSTIAMYETGQREPDNETLIKIANFFQVSTDYLLGQSDIRSPIETIAAHRSDDPMDELPEEARKSLEEFKDYILKKYGYKD
jgi:transcriptional regulator with XRE-family HTH domain